MNAARRRSFKVSQFTEGGSMRAEIQRKTYIGGLLASLIIGGAH